MCRPILTSQSHLVTYKYLVLAGEANVLVSGFNVLCPSLGCGQLIIMCAAKQYNVFMLTATNKMLTHRHM